MPVWLQAADVDALCDVWSACDGNSSVDVNLLNGVRSGVFRIEFALAGRFGDEDLLPDGVVECPSASIVSQCVLIDDCLSPLSDLFNIGDDWDVEKHVPTECQGPRTDSQGSMHG